MELKGPRREENRKQYLGPEIVHTEPIALQVAPSGNGDDLTCWAGPILTD